MPRIKICNAAVQSVNKQCPTVESHHKAAETLARLSCSGDSLQEGTSNTASVMGTRNDSQWAKRFPITLWEVLSNEANSSVIAWIPNGKGFSIFNREELISDVLPRYFKTKKYTSFTRRLNRWGFECFTKGHGAYVFHHPMFSRDRPELAFNMSCSMKTSLLQQNSIPQTCNDPPVKKLACKVLSTKNVINPNYSVSNTINMRNRMPCIRYKRRQHHMPKRNPILNLPQAPLMKGFLSTNIYFPETSSCRTQSIISNALRVLDKSDLKCLEILQAVKVTEYKHVSSQIDHGVNLSPLKLLGIGANAA